MHTIFRQGLISFQHVSGSPLFLLASDTPGYVDLNISPTPLLATIAHGSTDYLFKFDSSVSAAWGPLILGADNHLYLELDLISGKIYYTISLSEPTSSITAPVNPVPYQMWFDRVDSVMKIRNLNNTKWIASPRVIVGTVLSGNVNRISHELVGSSVELNTPGQPGFLMLDSQLRPLRVNSGELLTTDSTVRVKTTTGTSGSLSTPLNSFFPVRADEPIPAMSLVYISSADGVSLASSDPSLAELKTPIGIMQHSLALNEIGDVTMAGEIVYDQWGWSPEQMGFPVYCGSRGEIISTRPLGIITYRIGFIKNAKSIVIDIKSEIRTQVISTGTSIISGVNPITAITDVNSNNEIVTSISMRPATISTDGYMTAIQVASLSSAKIDIVNAKIEITALQNTKSNVGHIHDISDVNNLSSSLANKSNVGHFHSDYALIDHTHSGYALLNHSHFISDVAGLQDELNSKATITNLNIVKSDILSFRSELDLKVSASALSALKDEIELSIFDINNNLTFKASVIDLNALQGQVTELQDELITKAPIIHTHEISAINGLQNALDLKATIFDLNTKASIVDLNTKAPIIHTHEISAINGLQISLNAKASVTDLNTKSAIGHTHEISAINGLQNALDLKASLADLNNIVVEDHTHDIVDINGLQNALDLKATIADLNNKSAIGHAHEISNINNLQSALDLKASVFDLNTKAPVVHTHEISAINGLQNTLDLKSSIIDLNALQGQVTELQDELITKAPVVHTHEISAINGLQNTLDLKSNIGHGHDYSELTGFKALPDQSLKGGMILSTDGTDASWIPKPTIPEVLTVIKPAPLTTLTNQITDFNFGSAAHHNLHYRSSSTSTVSITIQPDSFWTGTEVYSDNDYNPTNPGAMPIGGTAVFGKHNAGDVVFISGAGVTINSPDSNIINKLNGKITLIKVSANLWDLEGNLASL